MRRTFFTIVFAVFPAVAGLAGEAETPRCTLLSAPDGGVQPQAAIDEGGTIHVVYLKGDPRASDVYYARLKPGEKEFTAPARVNGEPGSAIAAGTIRGVQVALGRGGRLHVAWNGSDKAKTRNVFGGTPMLYTRLDPRRGTFEPERNVMKQTSLLDGGGSVAADGAGNVYVAWHVRSADAEGGERARKMYVARSADDGATFGDERPALDRETGACACCGTRALADEGGNVYLLFRAATGDVERDMTLLASRDRAAHFSGESLQPWQLNTCPMSSSALIAAGDGALAAWETKGQLYVARVDGRNSAPSAPFSPPGDGGDRKHPALAVNARGQVLLAWAAGTGWQRGGDLVWQVFDRDGRPLGRADRLEAGIPTWGLPTAVAREDGSFVIVH